MSARDPLVNALRVLKNAAPEEFAVFMKAFDYYTEDAMAAVTEAPAEEILKMQGRAQQCRGLLLVLDDAMKDRSPARTG